MNDKERKEELKELLEAVNKYLGTNRSYEEMKERVNSNKESSLHDYFAEDTMNNYFD